MCQWPWHWGTTFWNIRVGGDIGYHLIQLTLLRCKRMGALTSTTSITARTRSPEVAISVLWTTLQSPPLIPHRFLNCFPLNFLVMTQDTFLSLSEPTFHEALLIYPLTFYSQRRSHCTSINTEKASQEMLKAHADIYPCVRLQGNEGWGTDLKLRFHFFLDIIRKYKLWKLQVNKDFKVRSHLSNCQSLPFLVTKTLSCLGKPFEQSFLLCRCKVSRTYYSGGSYNWTFPAWGRQLFPPTHWAGGWDGRWVRGEICIRRRIS